MPKRNFYCPFTKNRKFEVFLEDLFELGFNNDRNRQEIILYIQAVETYYTEKLRDLYVRKHHASAGRSHSQLATINENGTVSGTLDKNGLVRVLTEAVEEVKKQIMKRRVKQEVKYGNKGKHLRTIEKAYNNQL